MSESKPEIESNVPKNQELRGDLNAVERGDVEDCVYSPVITVTKEEITSTKEDLKVHKVVTTEDVSESIIVKETEIQGHESGSNVLVSVTKREAIYSSVGKKGDKDVNNVNNNLKQTRIPKLNFKQAVDKVKREKQLVQEKAIFEPVLGIRVKSSIPRLKEAKLLAQKSHLNGEEIKENSKKLDDEFDKIYQEVEDNSTEVSIPSPDSLRDDEIVDSIFEDIIHAYDENVETVKQEASIEKVKSKIPLLKRKSEQELVVPSNRRGSLIKRNSVDESKIPVHTKSIIINDLESLKVKNSKISESYSTIKSESITDKNIESFESSSVVKTTRSQKSIETERTNVSSGEVIAVKSSEVSKCKIPVISHMKDTVETKVSSVTLNRLPVRTNIIEKISNQNVDVEFSKSSHSQADIKFEKNNNISQSVTKQISTDHQRGAFNTDTLNHNVQKISNQQIIQTNQENIFSTTTENKISSNTSEFEKITTSSETEKNIQNMNAESSERLFSVNSSLSGSNLAQTENLLNSKVNLVRKDSDLSENIILQESSNEQAKVTEKTNVQVKNIVIETVNVTTLENNASTASKETILVGIPKVLENVSTISNTINSKELNKEEIKKEEDVNESNVTLKESGIASITLNENQNKLTSDKKKSVDHISQTSIQSIKPITASIVNVNKQDNYLSDIGKREELIGNTTENSKIQYENTKQDDAIEINKKENLPVNNVQIENKEIKITKETTGEILKESKISIEQYNVTTNLDNKINSYSDKIKIGQETNKSISSHIKNIKDLDEEDIIILKGKVNRIISRLDSREVKIEKTEDDMPKNVSVISKVAIFERNEPEIHKNDLNDENAQNDKPVIVDEILKLNLNSINDENTLFNYNKNKENSYDYDSVFNKVHSSVVRRLKSIETKTNTNFINETNKEEIKIHKIEIEKLKKSEEEETDKLKTPEAVKVKSNYEVFKEKSLNSYNRTKSLAELHFNETNNNNENVFDAKFRKFNEEKRAKSLAELDLGAVVKGRVKQMVLRMNSIEKVSQERRVFERCRSRGTVLSRAAVFEKKVVPIRAEEYATKSEKASVTPTVNEEEITEKIKELSLAKTKYGKWEYMPNIELRDGSTMPVLALGTALLEPKLIKHIVSAAIDLGYRAIDTAFIYGNEKEVGEAIRSKIEDGTVKREDLFIQSKLWSTFHRRDLVEAACRNSLQNMEMEYFDLYMMHNPMSFREGPNPIPKIANVLQYSQHDYLEAWFGMEAVAAKGLARSIGFSNFNSAQVDRIMEKAKIKPVINQVECHPYLAQHNLDDFCAHRNVKLSCFSVLGSKGTPLELKSGNYSVIDDPLIQVMAAGLGVTPAQLLIAYQVFHSRNVVVKSSTGAHLWDNLLALNLKLDDAQVSALDALNKNKRTFTFKGMGDTHKNYPFKTAF